MADSLEQAAKKALEAMTAMCQNFPTDSDMMEANWATHEINGACDAYEKGRAAIATLRSALHQEAGEAVAQPELFARMSWPHKQGEHSTFRVFKTDPTDMHAPWFLVMPGGASLELNHCADDAIDEARCRWMAAALNAALYTSPPIEQKDAGDGKDAARYRWLREGVHALYVTPGPDEGNSAPGLQGSVLDAAIDAAIATRQGTK